MKVDIDALLGKDILTLVIGGKEYVVKDIPLDVFLSVLSSQEEDLSEADKILNLRNQLAILTETNVKEFDAIGIRTLTLTLKTIREWFSKTDESEKGGSETGRP